MPVKTTTFPVYEIGVRSGTLSVVRHEYLRTYNGIRNVLSQLRGEEREALGSKYTSLEISKHGQFVHRLDFFSTVSSVKLSC